MTNRPIKNGARISWRSRCSCRGFWLNLTRCVVIVIMPRLVYGRRTYQCTYQCARLNFESRKPLNVVTSSVLYSFGVLPISHMASMELGNVTIRLIDIAISLSIIAQDLVNLAASTDLEIPCLLNTWELDQRHAPMCKE